MLVTMLMLFFKALLFGFIVAAPVGPVGAMVIKRTLHHGRSMGFFTGAGSAMGDTLYAIVVGLGISAVGSFVTTHEQAISLFGGLVLLVVGSLAVRKNVSDHKAIAATLSADVELDQEMGVKVRAMDAKFEQAAHSNASFWSTAFRATLGSFLITISNPVTIVGFAGTFAAFGFWSQNPPHSVIDPRYLTVVGGIMCGALGWWLFLASLVHRLGNGLSSSWIFRIHVSTSLVIIFSAFLCLGRAFMLR